MELRNVRGAVVPVRPRGRFVVNSVTCIRSLVEAGRGLHLGPRWAFAESLERGRVVEVAPAWQVDAYPLHVVHASSSYVPAKIRVFSDLFAQGWRD